jgi:transposase
MKLTVKSTKELLQVLDETKEALFKDRKCVYPYTEWEHKRAQVKERLHRLPEYVHQNLSESGFSADKGRFGSLVKQRREDRQQTALFSNALFHNIYTIRINPK